jgi:hypothetical protein
LPSLRQLAETLAEGVFFRGLRQVLNLVISVSVFEAVKVVQVTVLARLFFLPNEGTFQEIASPRAA